MAFYEVLLDPICCHCPKCGPYVLLDPIRQHFPKCGPSNFRMQPAIFQKHEAKGYEI
jgi:hypothetical protein